MFRFHPGLCFSKPANIGRRVSAYQEILVAFENGQSTRLVAHTAGTARLLQRSTTPSDLGA